jgi:hypothetical protein
MNKHTTTTLAAIFATSVASFAGTKKVEPSVLASEATLTGNIGVNVASAYVYRGKQLDCGTSVQPYLNLDIPTGVNGLSLTVGTKQNFQSNSPNFVWYRSEIDAGLKFKVGRLEFAPYYESVTSPDKRFNTSQGVNLVIGLDDKGLFPFTVHPYVKTYVNVDSAVAGTTGGHYYEVGIKPTVNVYGTTVAFPVSVGVGDNKFYTSNTTDSKLTNNLKYGYTSVGIATDTPLSKNLSVVTETTAMNTSDVTGSKNPNIWFTSGGLSVKF